ncbi:hypothetical protein GCM10009602_69580 [Nocardiopsis tropica]
MSGAPFPLGETVVFLAAGQAGRDEMGLPVPGPVTETPVAGCAVWPRMSSEQDQGREQVVIGLVVFVPPGVEVPSADTARVRGTVYEVDGEPGFFRSPLTGHASGTQVTLKRVTG